MKALSKILKDKFLLDNYFQKKKLYVVSFQLIKEFFIPPPMLKTENGS